MTERVKALGLLGVFVAGLISGVVFSIVHIYVFPALVEEAAIQPVEIMLEITDQEPHEVIEDDSRHWYERYVEDHCNRCPDCCSPAIYTKE